MKKFKVPVKFIFDGYFEINAETEDEAIENVERHCGLVIGGDIHSTLPDEDVDWDFNVHSEKEIGEVELLEDLEIERVIITGDWEDHVGYSGEVCIIIEKLENDYFIIENKNGEKWTVSDDEIEYVD